MARVAFPLVLQSPSSGSAIVGATATITQHVIGGSPGTGPAATIYLAETGNTKVTGNQITTDDTGRWTQGASAGYAQYWLPQGTYDVQIAGTGLTTYAITRELFSAGQSDEVALAGEVKWGAWIAIPTGFLDGDGSAVSRSTYSPLFNALTIQTTGTTASGNATVTGVPAAAFTALQAIAPSSGISIPISGPNIPTGTRLIGYSSGGQTLTLSQPASGNGNGVAIVIAPHGVGDGSTTFNLPLLRKNVAVGSDQSAYILGATGGEAAHILTGPETPNLQIQATNEGGVPPNAFGGAVGYQEIGTGGVGYGIASTNQGSFAFGLDTGGGGGPHNNLPPYIVLRGIVRHGLQ